MSNTVEVVGEKLVASGLCLSRNAEGEIFFVDGLIPGEKANVSISKTKGSVSFADVSTILFPSDHRTEPPCPHVADGCGGCDWQHIKIDVQPIYKREIIIDALARVGKISDASAYVEEPIVCEPERYRTTARILATRKTWGFRAKNSNDIVEVRDCMVLNEECLEQTNDVMSTIRDNGEYEAQVRRQPDVFQGRSLKVSPESFFQSHIDAPSVLADLVQEAILPLGRKLKCVDLYSGVGVLALAMAAKGHKVISVENSNSSSGDAMKNLKGLNTYTLKCDVKRFDFSKQNFMDSCDVVVADPSREGLKAEGVKAVLGCDPEMVILVSCDPASGARDISLLEENGYRLDRVVPIDMFGFNHHVEMFSVLTK